MNFALPKTYSMVMPKRKSFKHPHESETIMTEVVFPNDANPLGFLNGGRLVQWMDTASAVCAQTHAEKIAVTVSLDKMAFRHPAKVGDIITIKAKVSRAFETSMEIYVCAWTRSVFHKENILVNEAFFTFVAIDEHAKPTQIPGIKPLSKEEKSLFRMALLRKKHRHK